MTSEELADIRAYVAQRAAARARGEHIDSDERREAALLAALDEARAQLAALHAASTEREEAREMFDNATMGDEPAWSRSMKRNSAAKSALDDALADLATAAAEHERRVRADERVKALQDAEGTLDIAAALAERDRAPAEAATLRAVAHRLRAMADEAAKAAGSP